MKLFMMKTSAEIYKPSTRQYRGLEEPFYPLHDKTVNVTDYGRICIYQKEDQPEYILVRASGRHQRGRRRHMARLFYEL
jgi:hypothetical protein